MAERKKHLGTIQVRIQTPSNNTESSIAGGLNEYVTSHMLEEGLSNLLGVITGNDNIKAFKDLASLRASEKSIFNPAFTTEISDVIKNIDKNVTKSVNTLDSINSALASIAVSMLDNEKQDIDTNTIKIAIDAANATNISGIVNEIKNMSSNKEELNTALAGLKKIDKFFTKLQELFDEDGIISTTTESMLKIFPLIESNAKSMNEIVNLYAIINSIGTIDTSTIRDYINTFVEVYKEIGDSLKELSQIDITDNVDIIKERLAKIKDLYDTDISVTAAAINSHSADVQAIKNGTESSYEVAISGNDLDEDDIDMSMSVVSKTIDAIVLMGVCMLIGGAIIKRHPDLIIGSLMFGATFAGFLLELMIPIALLTTLVSRLDDTEDVLGAISGFVVISSLIMMAGAAFAMKDRFVKGALRFGLIFALFLLEILKAIDIAVGGFKDGKIVIDLDGLGSFITRAVIIMTLGGMFMTSTFVIPALKFGGVFALFLAEIFLATRLLKSGTKKEASALEGVGGLLFVCMGLMLLGAYIVTNTELVEGALEFGVVFGKFLFCAFLPLWVFKILSIGLSKLIDSVSNLLIKCTLIMLIGALFVSQPKLWQASLRFGVLMGAFITVILAPLWFFTKATKWAWAAILSIALFIQTVIATMLIGALIVRDLKTVGLIAAFGFLVFAFIWAILKPFKMAQKELTEQFGTLLAMSVFILVTGHVLKVAARITHKYGWDALFGAAIMAGFVWAMTAVMKTLSTIQKTSLVNILLVTIGIAGIIFTIAFALKIVKSTNVTIRDVGNLALMIGVVALMMFMVKMISSGSKNKPKFLQPIVGTSGLTMKDVATGLALMAGIALTILVIGITLALVKKTNVTFADTIPIIAMMTAALLMLVMVNRMVYGGKILGIKVPISNTDTTKSALLIMIGIAGVIMSIGFALKMVSDANVTPGHIISIVVLMLASVLMLAMINRIVHGGTLFGIKVPISKIDTIYKALAIMGAISLVILSIGYAIKLIAESGATLEHLAILGLMIVAVGGMAILISKFGLIDIKQTYGAILILASLTAIVIGLAYAIRMVATSGANDETLKLIGIMTAIVVALGALCVAIGLLISGPQAVGVAVGVAVIASLVVIVRQMAKAIQEVATAAMMADAEKDSVSSLKTFFENFLKVFKDIEIKDFTTLVKNAGKIGILLNKIVPPMGKAANLVAQVASLTIPIEWNEKGKATKFRRLSPTDFTTASANISTIISTLAEGLVITSTTLFKEGGPTYSELKRTITTTKELSSVISSVAKGIQQYSKLMVADDWSEDGKPKHYTKLSKQDFKNAAENITTIIALLGSTIANIANGKEITVNGQKIDTTEWLDAMDNGFLGMGTSRFSKVLNASTQLGKMISNIASGIQAFASMAYADDWDKNGKPIHFQHIGTSEIKTAQNNIANIITATTEPIIELANGNYANLFEEVIETRKKGWGLNENITRQSKFMTVLSGCIGIGEMIANLSLGVQAMANLAMPNRWDKNGKPIHYIKMDNGTVFNQVKENIKNIITASINGVTDAMKDTTFDSDTLSKVLSSVQPVGELVASLARGIKDIAELKIVSKYDDKGNPVEYIPLSKENFLNMKQNISDIISGSMTAVINSWDSLPEEYKNTDAFTDIMNAITNVGAVVDMAAGCVTSLVSDNVNTTSIINANNNVEEIFKTVIKNVLSDIKNINTDYSSILNRDAETNINTILSTVYSAISTLGRIMKTITSFNEYNIDSTKINNIVGENGILKTLIANINGFGYVNVEAIDNLTSLVASSTELFNMSSIMAKKLNESKSDINAAALDAKKTFDNISTFVTLVSTTAKTVLSTYSANETLNIINKTTAINTDITALTDIIESMSDFAKQLTTVNSLYDEFFVGETNSLTKLEDIITKINTTTSAITGIYTSADESTIRDRNNVIYSDKLNQLWMDVDFFTTAMEILEKTRDMEITTFSLPSGVTSQAIKDSIVLMKEIINTSFIGQLNTISVKGLKNSIEIIDSFDDIVVKLIEISAHTKEMSTLEDISTFATGIKTLNTEITNIDENKAKLITNEADTLDRFVKTIDKVDVSKVGRLTGLMDSMANLADKMGGFDNVVELLNGDFKNVLDKLSDKITDAKNTINKAERIENERQKKLNDNMNKIKKLMEQSITVNVGKLDENNNLAAGTESR